MAFELYSDVILTQDIQKCDLRTADIGTVVECRRVAGRWHRLLVEFLDMVGNPGAVVAVRETAVRRPTTSESRCHAQWAYIAAGEP